MSAQHQPQFDDAMQIWSEPDLVQTTRGLWPAAGLKRVVTHHEDENEWASAVEYWLGVELVHRSARTHIKEGLSLAGDQAAFG